MQHSGFEQRQVVQIENRQLVVDDAVDLGIQIEPLGSICRAPGFQDEFVRLGIAESRAVLVCAALSGAIRLHG
jgi:hypothetical protein